MPVLKEYEQMVLNELNDMPEKAIPNLLQIIKLFKKLCYFRVIHLKNYNKNCFNGTTWRGLE